MFSSMTGYGRQHTITEDKEILVEIKSVNHRYFEFTARVPRSYGYLEDKLKSLVQSKVSRGKVEVNLSIYPTKSSQVTISVNKELAQSYTTALRSLNEDEVGASGLNLYDDLSLSVISHFSDIFTVKKQTEDEESVWAAVMPVTTAAVDSFVAMRLDEGERMQTDVIGRLDTILEDVATIEKQAPSIIERYKKRISDKLEEILQTKDIDENRVLTEVAILSDKISVDEETVRLKSHIEQFKSLTQAIEPVGRKLDFLIQEINREVNTLGSKIQDIVVTSVVVNLKSELEKIREQIQNIE